MSMEPPPLNPKDTTNYLLGGMQKQLEAIAAEQKDARDSGEMFRGEIRLSVSGLRTDVDTLKAKSVPRAPWYSIVAGITGIVGGAAGFVALLRILNP